jgi:PAS domain S-box-containing protein
MITGIIPGKKKRPRWLLPAVALFLFVVLAVPAWNRNLAKASADQLTASERAWLKAHPVIRLAPDPDFPPVEYFDKDGAYSGLTADYVALIEKKLGIHIEIVRLRNWDEIISMAKSRQIDAYVATKTPQRAEYMLFTRPFLEFPVVIIAREKAKGSLNLEKLSGMKISVVSEYAAHNFIAYNYPKLHVDQVPDVRTGLRKVSFGLSDAFVENLATATYYIEKEGITNLRIAGESGYFYRMGFCSRQDWPELNRILDKGLAVISADEKKEIYKRWIPVEPGSLFASREVRTGLFAACAAILLMVAGVIAWNRALARQVRVRTDELEHELAMRRRMEEELLRARDELEERVEERTMELAETVMDLRFTQFAVDRSTDQAFWLTSDGRFFYVNDAACDSLGYTRDELVTMSVPEINPTCPPEEFPPYWSMLLEKGTCTFETLHRAQDGRVFPVEIRANLLVFDGKEYCCCFVTDITERKRAEEALREGEARLKTAMELARLAYWEFDVDSGMFTFNDQFYALYGTTVEREGGILLSAEDYVRKFIPANELERVAGCIAEEPSNPYFHMEHRIVRADGEERFIVVRSEIVRDEAGRIVKTRGANQDITERKQAEELLRKSEMAQRKLARELAQKNSFLRTLIDAIPDLIFYKDCNRAYLGFNRAFEAFAGQAETDLIGRTDFDIFSRDVAVSFRDTDLEVLSTEESRCCEEWIDYPDGRRVLLETLKTPFFNLDGEILGLVGVSRDITERKRMEEELLLSQFCMDQAGIGIFQSNEHGTIFGVNEHACKSLGYTREELCALSISDIDPEITPEKMLELKELLDEKGTGTHYTTHRRKDGSTYPVEIIANHLCFQGKTYGISFVKDITERRQAEEALRESESLVRRKLESILDPEGDIGELDLADILDASQIQALMEDLYRITGFRMSIIDLKGRVLVDVGWQPVCANYHRTHPETLKRCLESDTELTLGIPQGEFRTYRCKNNMWHIVTPIIVGGRHMANLFMGQFFFAGEQIDYDLFRAQARANGFPEEDYIAALEAVPRYSEELVNLGKAVFLRLTDMFSKLSYANVKLAHSVAERDRLTATLRQANLVVENSPVVLFRCTAAPGWPVELVSQNVMQFGYAPEQFLSGELTYASIVHPQDLKKLIAETGEFAATGKGQLLQDYRIVTRDGDVRWVIDEKNCVLNERGEITHLERIIIDVTEWKEAEEELRENLKLLQTIMRHAPIILCGVDRHGVFTLAEGKGLAGLGVKPGEYVGRSVFEVHRGMPEISQNYRRALAGEAFTASVQAGGRIYDVYHEPVFGDYGEYTGTLGVLVDVTGQRRVEEALRQANKVVENSPAVLFRWGGDDAWPVELVSGNVIQFGYTPEDFLSGALTYSAIIHPDDLERVTREVHEFLDRGEYQIRLEYRILTKDSSIRWVNELTHVERDAAGCVRNFEGIVIDVTERKRIEEALRCSQEKYRSIVDAYDGFIYICSQDYRVEFMNRKLIERTGRDATGGLCYEVLHGRDSICPWCVNERVFAGETVHWEIQSPKDGRWYHVVNVPIYNADGTISKHSVLADIHDLKVSEEKLKEQKQLLTELNATLEKRVQQGVAENREKDILLIQQNRQAALGEMLDHIAHQWKQPLNSISLLVQELEETSLYGELTTGVVEDTVGKTIALVRHMAQTIDTFRGFYRPDKERKVFNIKESVDQALAFIAPAFRFHSIAVELDVDPGLTAFGYPKEYAQVLLNILANARDIFLARGTEKPRVKLRAFAEGKKAVVTVEDNGGGIPEAIMGRIFDFYFTTNEAGGGTGIGLYMSRNIIEKSMGGTLSAVNAEGGAQFRIEISPT